MKIIGERLRKKRIELGFDIDYVSANTKIRKEYITALEKEDFTKFTSHVFAKGFIKNYAKFLGLDDIALLAVYRRDYENFEIKRIARKENDVEPKKTFKEKLNLNITRRNTGLIIFGLIIVGLIVLLFNVLNKSFSQPEFKITSPVELSSGMEQTIDYFESTIVIKGETAAYTVIKINEVPISLKTGFNFESDIYPITSDKTIFNITATSQLGVTSSIKLTINKKDKSTNKIEGISGVVSIIGSETNLEVVSDGQNVIYSSQAFESDSFPVTAKSELKVTSSDPTAVRLFLNNAEYRLSSSTNTFTLNDGNIIQSE